MRPLNQAALLARIRRQAVLGLLALPWVCSATPLDEYQIKAAFLYNFAKFVTWPQADHNERPITFVVFGKDPFGAALEQAVRGKTVRGRPLVLRRTTRVEELKPCDLVFIGRSESKRLTEVLRSLEGQAVLRVGETPEFLRAGGMINFVLQDNKVRFEISVAAARRAGLEISSRLLSLATLVLD